MCLILFSNGEKIGVFYSAFRALAHVIEAEMMPQYSADRPSCRPAAAAAPEGLILSWDRE